MESQGVPKEAEAEGDGILKIGDMQLPGRLISDASEEIMLLWAIGQPCTARQNNFVKQTSNHLKLDACGHNLSIQQSPSSMNTSGVTGGVMWDSGIVLGKFLEHAVDCDLLNLRGKKCVELGSGCGLVGCIAALLGGNAILTDMPDRLRLLAKNVEENVRELDARGSASVRELTWGEDLDSDLLNPLPDYVLGSDVVYSEAIVHDLLTTLQGLCGNHTIIFISAELRNGRFLAHGIWHRALENFVFFH
ncbi:uncharacterized protein LOC131067122 isoform X3 [Cryptomeria japonica]|uniref:uncharacterized protein LOC131067122 isoform X3 n=1 Tax=Cryptomeria japonica TaxID=3369 RepID=UPI0027D9D457|nr:uncharacterized protein LOC131067122 isoform X3 [Cryptomeria japonica]